MCHALLLYVGARANLQAMAVTEAREMRRDLSVYVEDRRNVLDVLALATLAAGFVV